jgi:hypothetical protein
MSSQVWVFTQCLGERGRAGDIVPRPRAMAIETLLVQGRNTARSHLKYRLLAGGLKENRCEECGLEQWRGRPLSMAYTT